MQKMWVYNFLMLVQVAPKTRDKITDLEALQDAVSF